MAELEEYPNWGYEPPITLQIANEIHEELVRNAEETILKEIVRLGVNVDRDELILALQYDRKQYEKGYADAMAAVARRGSWTRIDYVPCGHDYICSECKGKNDRASDFCPDCGADMREVNVDG